MPEAKTKSLDIDFETWCATEVPSARQAEARTLNTLFTRASGHAPRLWTGGMVGYGAYDYTYDSGHSGTWFATGFAPRAARISVYIMPGYADFSDILCRLGPYKMGKSCLYITRLSRVDSAVLEELVTAGLADLARQWPIRAAEDPA